MVRCPNEEGEGEEGKTDRCQVGNEINADQGNPRLSEDVENSLKYTSDAFNGDEVIIALSAFAHLSTTNIFQDVSMVLNVVRNLDE
mmetsp:Transcript_6830/g.13534  ORF Transcript_6830/g.13534 Transcript_6830/m.13534 type:complete len:86 (+) Transcript_6830:1074-1331(+)